MTIVTKQYISVFITAFGRFVFVAMCLFVAVAFVPNAVAQGGPPMITDDTETVPKHHFEINNGFTMERGSDGTIYSIPDIDFNYGLNKRMQLRIETPWVVVHNNGQPSL